MAITMDSEEQSLVRADSERVLARYVVAMAWCYVMSTFMFTPPISCHCQ